MQKGFDLNGFDFVETGNGNGHNGEWVIWDNPGKSISGWVLEFTTENLQGRDTPVCHMLIDVEDDEVLDTHRTVKFIMPLDLQKKLNQIKTNILERFSEYRLYIKLEEVKDLGNGKKYKVFKVGVKKEDMPMPSNDDGIEF